MASPWAAMGASFANRASQGVLGAAQQRDSAQLQMARDKSAQDAAASIERQKMYREMQNKAYAEWGAIVDKHVDPNAKPEEQAARYQNAVALFKRAFPQYYNIIGPEIEQAGQGAMVDARSKMEANMKRGMNGPEGFRGLGVTLAGPVARTALGAASAVPSPLQPAAQFMGGLAGMKKMSEGPLSDVSNEFSLRPNPMQPGREMNPDVMGPRSKSRLGIEPPPAMFQSAPPGMTQPIQPVDPYYLPKRDRTKPIIRRR